MFLNKTISWAIIYSVCSQFKHSKKTMPWSTKPWFPKSPNLSNLVWASADLNYNTCTSSTNFKSKSSHLSKTLTTITCPSAVLHDVLWTYCKQIRTNTYCQWSYSYVFMYVFLPTYSYVLMYVLQYVYSSLSVSGHILRICTYPGSYLHVSRFLYARFPVRTSRTLVRIWMYTRPPPGLSLRPDTVARSAAKAQGPPLVGWGQATLRGAYLGEGLREGADGMVDGGFDTVPVMHWWTHLCFEGSVAALGLKPQTVWKRAPYVHPEVSHNPPLPPASRHSGMVRCQGPSLAGWGQATLRGAYLEEGRGWGDGGWRIYQLWFWGRVEWTCSQTLKRTSRGSQTRFPSLFPQFIDGIICIK